MFIRSKAVFLAVVMVSLVGCAGVNLNPASSTATSETDLDRALRASSLPFRSIAVGRWKPFLREPYYRVLESQADMDEVFAGIDHLEYLQDPIDFDREVGVLVVGPTYPCITRLEVLSVEERHEGVVIHSASWDVNDLPDPPPPNLDPERIPVCSTEADCPYHLIAIARPSKPVSFSPLIESYSVLRPADRLWPFPVSDDAEGWKSNPRGGVSKRALFDETQALRALE